MQNKKRLSGLVLAMALVAAACGSDGDTEAIDTADEAVTESAESTTEDDAMEDEEAMEDDAMEDDEDAMADEEDAMEDDAMEDDAMAEGRPILNISFSGLEPLGDDFEYEAWTIVDDAPVTGGIFDINEDGDIEISSDQDHLYGHDGATAIVITIEPAVGDDPAPADTHVLAGDISEDGTFDLSIGHPAAIGTDFADVAGSFILGTPTDDPEGNELSGVWFLSVPGPETSLDLPELPAGWVYEGWAVIDDQPISTGRFTDPAAADDFSGFSGDSDGPNYPGEDFLVNAPDGLTFPTDLTESTIVISVEPDADNSPAPFALKPLVAEVPEGISDHENIDFGAGPVDISGSGSVEG